MTVDTMLEVRGMDCAACAQRLRTALGRLDGVLAADPDHRAGRVAVRFDPAQVSAADITRRLRDVGFEVVGAAERGNGDGDQRA